MQRKKAYSLGETLGRYLADSPLAQGLQYGRVCSAWDCVVGEAIAKMTSGKRFEKGVLTVRLTSSVLRAQLEMNKEDIRRRVNASLGEELVAAINLR